MGKFSRQVLYLRYKKIRNPVVWRNTSLDVKGYCTGQSSAKHVSPWPCFGMGLGRIWWAVVRQRRRDSGNGEAMVREGAMARMSPRAVARVWSCSATQKLPGAQNDNCWHAAGVTGELNNKWKLKDHIPKEIVRERRISFDDSFETQACVHACIASRDVSTFNVCWKSVGVVSYRSMLFIAFRKALGKTSKFWPLLWITL